jgi:antitoxin component of MazEF toxin-antitoxin module
MNMAKIVKAGGKLALVLPDAVGRALELAEGDELALHELGSGAYAITRKGARIGREVDEQETGAGATKGGLDDEALRVLRKLESIRFEMRTPKKVGEVMTNAERHVLDALVENKVIGFFKSAKYKEGVYNIPKDIYELVRGSGKKDNAAPVTAAGASSSAAYDNPEESLEKLGYAIVEREQDAKLLSERLNPQIKSGELMGVRGFDRRFYLARKGFYVAVSERLEKALRGKKSRTVPEIAHDAKVKEDECAVVLNLMREEGEVLEKKRGTYELA